MRNNLLVIVIIKVLLLCLINGQKYRCDKKQAKFIDEQFRDYFLFASKTRKFPTNSKEMKTFCK